MALSLLILTGQSGSGKSTAIRALEDHGYFCIDNLPVSLVAPLVELADDDPTIHNLALVMDLREPRLGSELPAMVGGLRAAGVDVRLLYLEANEAALIRRYSETRRRHPLDDGCGLRQAILHEHELLVPMREIADQTLDTSAMSPHTLRAQIIAQIVNVPPGADLHIALLSFGFKFGLPLEADLVFDVRFLDNPYFDPDLRTLTGCDAPVREFVVGSPAGRATLAELVHLLDFLLPHYTREGRRYLTVAVGCTGGQHRSVAIVEAIAAELSARGVAVHPRHRDIRGVKP